MFRLRVAPEVGYDAAFTTFSNYWFEFELMAMENAESCVVVSSNSDVNNFLHGNTVEVNINYLSSFSSYLSIVNTIYTRFHN